MRSTIVGEINAYLDSEFKKLRSHFNEFKDILYDAGDDTTHVVPAVRSLLKVRMHVSDFDR